MNDTMQQEVAASQRDVDPSADRALEEELPKFAYVPSGAERLLIFSILLHGQFVDEKLDMLTKIKSCTSEGSGVKVKVALRTKDKYDLTSDLRDWLSTLPGTFSQLDIDVIDILCMVYLASERKPDEYVDLKISDICRIRGLKRKNAGKKKNGDVRLSGYTPAQRRNVIDALKRIYYCYVTVEGKDKINQKVTSKEYVGQLIDFPESVEKWNARTIKYKVSGALISRIKNGAWQASLLPVDVIQLHTKDNNWEKAIARYLYWLFRVRTTKTGTTNIHLAKTLIQQVLGPGGEVSKPNLRRLHVALDVLKQRELIKGWEVKKESPRLVPDPTLVRIAIEPPDGLKERYKNITAKPSADIEVRDRLEGDSPRTEDVVDREDEYHNGYSDDDINYEDIATPDNI